MNKKRVALALAAALGINSLMVTVGTVGGQAVIAHAQDSRLSADLAAKLDALKIKYLETSVEVTTNGNTEVTFKGLDFNNVNKIDAGTFVHEIFTERTGIETNGNGATGTWNATTQKLTVSGMTEPGIYTGDVTVTYKDGSTEKYTLSLVKKPSDTISFDTEVGAGSIKLSNINFNNGASNVNFKPQQAVFSLNGVASDPVPLTNDAYTLNLLKLGNGGKLKETDKLEVTFKYGAGNEYNLTSQILLFKENSQIVDVAATNDTTAMATLKTNLESAFATSNVDTGTLQTGVNSYPLTIDGKKLFTYDQTVGEDANQASVVGGAKLALTSTTSQVSIAVSEATPATGKLANYVPNFYIQYGSDSTAANITTGLIGSYSFKVGSEAPKVYFEGLSGVAVTTQTTAGTGGASNIEFLKFDPALKTTMASADVDANAKVTLGIEKFDHGYSYIPVEFSVNSDADKKKIDDVKFDLTNNKPGFQSIIDNDATPTVKTSIIVGADLLDGAAVQASFVKTSSSEGKVTIAGGTELLTKFVGSADYTKSVLTIAGGTATVNSAESIGKDLVFDVQFNGQVPSKSDAVWTLDINGKKIEGTVDLTGGAVESVNLTSVKATNQGMENVTDQFKVEASFGSAVPTGGKVVVDGANSDRVTFAQFDGPEEKLNNVVSAGKYQGTYSAGVIVSDQPIAIDIAEYAKTSSSVTLEIDADFFGNATTGVKAAYISYREAGTNNPYKELDLAIPQDIKDGVITKVVSGLKANTKYEFVAVYTYNETNNPLNIESNVLTVVTNPTSSNSGTISGGSSGSSSSTSSTTVNVTGTNSTTGSNSISVTLPSGTYHHESNSNPSIAGFKYKDKDGKTVTETNDQYSNVKVRFENGRVVVDGLVPGKDYVEISINYNDRNNRTRTLFLKNVKINATNEGQSYLANVYNVVFNRPADENGYMFHFDNLSNKRVSLRAFLLNMINEREFEKIYTTAETKVEALYNAIVNRDSDTQGKAFWVEEYKKLLAVYGSATATLQAIADRMVNETELKNLAQKINFEW